MTEPIREYVTQWLIKANEDIAVIERLFLSKPEEVTGAICFHSQQAVEKFLKAFLASRKNDFRPTHDVDFLLSECVKIDQAAFLGLDLKSLADFAVNVRYPDDFFVPEMDEALSCSELAKTVKKIVEKTIPFV
ncbi:MAG: hypothetical protein A2268_13715 [Candidatus Raymondbacteria bacterium RifOxyA12_full_50_37]|uniref:HEPN domain-containing protein n=1 Tax=Candidatus Raymondbacteria bacterium RIFOXYD12_FULL_49_13 TaxID=1817890 RepID=A0A1F7FM28_UNCRA|nr:MAG: hypothetical protein A2248_08130 [Candidatus Raymondbacteria bacterium RIFOXYA2_FULL_49_16]OGJ87206.1 MAG: hypothetical protein A2350_04380 [Candidatus Raymondbacteria bacterium RifOxyB12_full_50_8]OGJ91667.1 MAG: hypothetical protein A2268_13715 [Candidatus Raymondbacteria bacterium RifOxyA12_full_50_37]OGJ95222.1 MAG: hypothetical protein A2453_12140 [Candidatus Raymondbacteria bacterium RIFOXYC2_FULL_50_21]OGK06000.1 MAG: hypothetical protein A2487_14455 [Candidatus Raymondbacteria b